LRLPVKRDLKLEATQTVADNSRAVVLMPPNNRRTCGSKAMLAYCARDRCRPRLPIDKKPHQQVSSLHFFNVSQDAEIDRDAAFLPASRRQHNDMITTARVDLNPPLLFVKLSDSTL
jgi:hypothetical protein